MNSTLTEIHLPSREELEEVFRDSSLISTTVLT